MKKFLYFILVLPVFTSLLVISCTANHPGSENTSTPPNASQTTPIISSSPTETVSPSSALEPSGTGISIDEDSIIVRGHADLEDDTLLRTQMYQDGEPLEWWAAGQDVAVHGGQWFMYVPLGQNGVPDNILWHGTYTFEAWEKDDPSNIVGFVYFKRPKEY